MTRQLSETMEDPLHQPNDESIDPSLDQYDPSISDSERIRRANRRFEECLRRDAASKAARR
jgi:hypothetical protein